MIIKCLLFLFLSIFISCKNELPLNNSVNIISYNLQNFFDGEDNGYEYDEFLLSGDYWSRKRYEIRLNNLFQMLKTEPFSSSDIIFFQELENENILKELLIKGLSKRGFIYYGAVNSGTPLSIGFISKIKPIAITSNATDSSRSVLGFEAFICDEQVFIYTLHAKSNIGCEDENKRKRKEMGMLLKFLTDEKKGSNIIILGDFNEEFSYASNLENGYVPIGLYSKTEIDSLQSIAITGDKKKLDDGVFYSPFLDLSTPINGEGTYYYKGKWYFFDNVLLSSTFCDGKGVEFKNFSIIKNGEIVENEIPYRYDIEKGKGYSDHFPIKVEIGG